MGAASSAMVEVLFGAPFQACVTRRTQIEARVFKSPHVHHFASIAQPEELLFCKQAVAGSIPARCSISVAGMAGSGLQR